MYKTGNNHRSTEAQPLPYSTGVDAELLLLPIQYSACTANGHGGFLCFFLNCPRCK